MSRKQQDPVSPDDYAKHESHERFAAIARRKAEIKAERATANDRQPGTQEQKERDDACPCGA